eukprot:TRINITY_DN4464_c0_g1_i1.p3 TRINITY_DN4464_c0_g1~~TRINITY_DN4464_c0_g1_i1.p3  ORF type:complete len:149 (+),score=16.71 TRINITY_DN4464_c0_g1_i1:376-822(+)
MATPTEDRAVSELAVDVEGDPLVGLELVLPDGPLALPAAEALAVPHLAEGGGGDAAVDGAEARGAGLAGHRVGWRRPQCHRARPGAGLAGGVVGDVADGGEGGVGDGAAALPAEEAVDVPLAVQRRRHRPRDHRQALRAEVPLLEREY